MNALYLIPSALLVCAAPALANVVVASPHPSAKVISPFWLSAKAEPCSSQAISAMGYSFDNSTYTAIVPGDSVSASVGAGVGAHVVHVKSWGVLGAACVSDITITVVPSPVESVPAHAKVAKELQLWTGWHAIHDTGA